MERGVLKNDSYSDTTNKDWSPQKATLIQKLQIMTGVYKHNPESDTTNKDMSPEKLL